MTFGETVVKAIVLRPILLLVEILDWLLDSKQPLLPMNMEFNANQRKAPYMKRVDKDQGSDYK